MEICKRRSNVAFAEEVEVLSSKECSAYASHYYNARCCEYGPDGLREVLSS